MDLSCKRLLSFFTSRSLITFSPFSLPTAGFPRGAVDLLRTLFHFLPSVNPPPPPPPSYLLPPHTLPLILSPVPYFFFPSTAHDNDIIPSHMASSCSTFHNTHLHARARERATLKSPAGPSVSRREQKCSSLSYGPTLARCGMKQPLLFESGSVSCFKVLIRQLKRTRCR